MLLQMFFPLPQKLRSKIPRYLQPNNVTIAGEQDRKFVSTDFGAATEPLLHQGKAKVRSRGIEREDDP
jgi:hypothetical protein